MKYIRILFILTLFISNTAFGFTIGKTSLSGKVTDSASKEPLFGVTIFIPDLQTGAISGFDGSYKITNLPQTKVLIQVSCIGYKSILKTVDLSTTDHQDFMMESSIKEINTFVVTGTSVATEIKQNPVPITVVGRLEINQIASTNIIDAIATQPGINAVTTGPNVSKPFIRGLGFNRVLTLYYGVRQEGQQWGDEHGVEADEYSIDRIEVVKGPSSLIYGSDAMAGVVSLLPPHPVPNGCIKGGIITNYETNNGEYAISGSLDGNHNDFVWGGRITHKQATNYQNSVDGRVFGTAYNENDANGYIGVNRSWGFSHIHFSVFDDLQEIPDGSRDSATGKFTKQVTEADDFRPIVSDAELNSYKIGTLHQHVEHYRIISENNFILGEGKLSFVAGYQESVRREFNHPENADVPGLYLILPTFTYDLKYYLPTYKGWQTTVGINGMYQTNTNKGTDFIIPDYNEFDVGPFVYIKKTLGRVDINGGIRFDNRSFSNNAMFIAPNVIGGDTVGSKQVAPGAGMPVFPNYQHDFSGLSGSFGMTYNFTEALLAKANVARGFRAPNIAEISANGVHPGSNIFQMGNPDFKPEFSLQEDIGIELNTKHVNASIEVFNNDISDYIYNAKLLNKEGGDSIVVPGNQTFRYASAHAQLYGGEVSIDIHPHPWDWLHFENSLSIVHGLNKGGPGILINDSNKYLPFIPPMHTHSELRADIKKKYTHFSSLYVKLDMEWYDKQDEAYLAYNTETFTPGYTLYGAGFGFDYTNKSGKKLFSINIAGSNITDVAYQAHLSRLKYFVYTTPSGYAVPSPSGTYGIYNMGRNISFKLTIPIDFKAPKTAS